jgi:hypothetical protein
MHSSLAVQRGTAQLTRRCSGGSKKQGATGKVIVVADFTKQNSLG